MNKLKLSQMAKTIQNTLTKHSPEILTGIGIAGMVTTTILAVRATPKALSIIEQERYNRKIDREHGVDERFAPEKVSKTDAVKLCWKCYIPAAATGTLSIACLIGASSVNARRNAALATAYTLSETALKEYQEKVVEAVGEKKEHAIHDAIAKDRIERDPVNNKEVIITEKGNTLCYDAVSGRYFYSDIDKIKKVVNELNYRMMDEMYISVNDLYSEIGLSLISIGDDLGWNIERGLIDLHFSTQLAEDDRPCLVINYLVAPRYNYK